MFIAAISSCRRSGRRSACAERAHQELCQKFQKEVLREDSGSGMMSRKGMRGPVMRAVSGACNRGLNAAGKLLYCAGKFRFGYEIGKFTVNSEIGAQDSGSRPYLWLMSSTCVSQPYWNVYNLNDLVFTS